MRKRQHQKTSRRPLGRTELAQTNGVPSLPLQTPTLSSPPKPSLEPQTRVASVSRKRQREDLDASEQPEHRALKRARPSNRTPQSRDNGETDETDETDPIAYWVAKGRWPARHKHMESFFARKKSKTSLRSRKRSEPDSASSLISHDQRLREEKSAPYYSPQYKMLLETNGSFMYKSKLGITDESKSLCRTLLEKEQQTPKDSLFRDDIFEVTCQKLEDRNEGRVIRDITPLIVPSAETLATYGHKELDCLIESINEGWSNSLPLTGTRPQPDFSVGFGRHAFSDEQLEKLSPFIGNFIAGDQSLFMATRKMYFPFLTCEVKCGAAALDIADRQNAHSMTLAVRAIIELFRLIGREKEVSRQILAFSISHNHHLVQLYGHYAVVQDKDTKYYRHPVRIVDFTQLDGKDKWTAYCFTRNIYDVWMPAHFTRICSAIDKLPSHLDRNIPSLPETRLSQELESHNPSESYIASESEANPQSSMVNAQGSPPDTTSTETIQQKD
ncbi:hypothetical protein H9Q70_009703 [Fusarium xylarioides]|nr:hypothetical protein H9Q70_009703 [Fusarium xylarioides]KAG5776410.1 hypothetical protein H9Q73_009921 [Fusarium xylarioides]